MSVADRLRDASIRGRFAFAAACLERVCAAWKLGGPAVDRLFDALWSFTSSGDLGRWDGLVGALTPNSPADLRARLPVEGLSARQVKLLYVLITTVYEVGYGNLYSGYDSEFTLAPVRRVLALLGAAGVEPPDPSPFARSRRSLLDGWGKAVPRSFFES